MQRERPQQHHTRQLALERHMRPADGDVGVGCHAQLAAVPCATPAATGYELDTTVQRFL